MDDDSPRRGWRIFARDTFIGTAYFRTADPPWYICDFEPTPAFAAYRAIFDEYAALVNDLLLATPASDIDVFYETQIEPLNLELRPFGNVWQGSIFVAQIFHGAEAWLRPV